MRLAILSCLAMLVTGSAAAAVEEMPRKSDAHVRPLQQEGRRLLAIGTTRSPTFQRLLTRLERSDVIVYVDVTLDVPPHVIGVLRFLAASRSARFVVLRLDRTCDSSALVGILGHELQHAVEVADAKDVTSPDDLARLYRRIGVQTGQGMYDTDAARQAGDDVRDEALHANRDVAQAAAMGRVAGRR
jgi:hypothetical protein